jgi:hypothetical protein
MKRLGTWISKDSDSANVACILPLAAEKIILAAALEQVARGR